jgi:hypothetical protein
LNLVKAGLDFSWSAVRDAVGGLFTATVNLCFTVVFLAHQTMLSLDAVMRSLVRKCVTQKRLLEWESAAETELNPRGRTSVDVYLSWMPLASLLLGLLVWAVRPHALWAAVPVLALWACSKAISIWLNGSPSAAGNKIPAESVTFLRRSALQTWRYFAEYSTAEHNWLIPDNVQEEPPAIAARVSPTNIGLLLNARQVACEFGYLTVPELVEQTGRTLATVASLRKHHGHVLNWYDTRTLQPMAPRSAAS